MKNKIYLIKFSLISFLFSIVVIVTHLLPNTDLLFIKRAHNPASDKPVDNDSEKPHSKPGA